MRSRRARLARSRGRGAAFVESLIFILVLILLDVGVLYMRDGYDAKLLTMRRTRAAVWSHAIVGCKGAGGADGASVAISGNDGSLGPISVALQPARSIARGTTLTKPLETDILVTSAVAAKTSRGFTEHVSSFSALHLTSRSSVVCNEIQQPVSTGDIRATIDSFYGDFF